MRNLIVVIGLLALAACAQPATRDAKTAQMDSLAKAAAGQTVGANIDAAKADAARNGVYATPGNCQRADGRSAGPQGRATPLQAEYTDASCS